MKFSWDGIQNNNFRKVKSIKHFEHYQYSEFWIFIHALKPFLVNKKGMPSFTALYFVLYFSAKLQGVPSTLIWLYFDLLLMRHDIIGQWIYGNPCNWHALSTRGMYVWLILMRLLLLCSCRYYIHIHIHIYIYIYIYIHNYLIYNYLKPILYIITSSQF